MSRGTFTLASHLERAFVILDGLKSSEVPLSESTAPPPAPSAGLPILSPLPRRTRCVE